MNRALSLAIVAMLALGACGDDDEMPLEVTVLRASAGGVVSTCPNALVALELELENKGSTPVRWSLGDVWVKHQDGHSMTPNKDGSLAADQFRADAIGCKDATTTVAPGAKVTVVAKTGYTVGFADYADKATTWRVSFELLLDSKPWRFEGKDITDIWPHTDCYDVSSRYSPCPNASCGNPTKVADEAALKSLVNALEVTWDSHSAVGCIGTSNELEAEHEIVIDLGEQPTGSTLDCSKRPRRFALEGTIPGLSCEKMDPSVNLGPKGCQILRIAAGTVFRVRAMDYDTHPSECNSSPLISVLPSCDTPCSNPDLKCGTTKICHSSYDEFCRRCEDRSREVCACRDATGRLAEGAECSYFVTDMGFSGTCQSGSCVTKEN